MKNILPFLAVIGLAIPPQAFALIGGPFDQNTPSGLYGGTYEAIYKFKNGNGIVRFSNSDAAANLNFYSFSLIFYKGIISEEEQVDDDGETQEITMLKEDIAKLLKE